MKIRYILNGNKLVLMAGLAWWIVLAAHSPAMADEVFSFNHVAKLRTVTAAKISPNGRHIAYILSVPRTPFTEDNGAAWSELHLVDVNGHDRAFVVGEVNVSVIDWTPDGSGISFLAKRGQDEHKSLYVIPFDGGEARKILEHDTDISSYSWNLDGVQIAFLAKEEVDKDKKKLKDKGFDAKVYEEDFRFTRVWIAEARTDEADTSADEEPAKPRMLALEGSISAVHWSPGGDRLAVARTATPLIDDHYMRRKVDIVDAKSGEAIAQLDNPGKLGAISWSPDGERLAVIAGGDLHDPDAGRLMVGSAKGGSLHDVIPGYEGSIRAIQWRDEQTVMYVGHEGVSSSFGEATRDGSSRNVIVPPGSIVLRSLSAPDDGLSAAFVSDSPKHPAEVFYMKHGDGKPRRLTQSNPWLSGVRLARQEVIQYANRDGVQIEGLLIHPLDEKPGQRYPLILTVHGGPEAHYSNGWLTRYSGPGQLAAARGFAVFYPNYRGSTGRGVAFSKSGQNDYAGKEFDDLIDGVDHLIATGLVDRDRVGVTGGSYGGFASAWCATYHSERFAASVMFVGISDQVSKFGTTDIPNEMYLVHSRRWPWEDWDYFRERSPLYHFQKCRTPILIMHGEDDTRVHPSQSMELYRYLKTYDKVPVRLVFFPGEGHGNRKAASRMEYNMRMMRWMEHYLKGPGGDPPAYELNYDEVKPEDDEEDAEDDEENDS